MSAIPPSVEPGPRILMGPGPSDVDPRVTKALSTPVTGHLDPAFLSALDGIRVMLQEVFSTQNETTFAVSGTGTAGMECCLTNLLEPGDACVVGVCGYFGRRIAEIAERVGARVTTVEAPFGEAVPQAAVVEAIERTRPKVAAIVHGETSTGVLQPVDEIGEAARAAGALFLLDCVTTLGGLPVEIDRWQVDAAYSGTQKCLSCPPGLAPVTFSPRAMKAIRERKRRPSTFYLDVELLHAYWSRRPAPYHHTAPIPLMFALHEGLRCALEEGLPARFSRHRRNHEALIAGIAALGLSSSVPKERRLVVLNPVLVPEGVDEAAVRRRLLGEESLEIGAGLGPLAGRIWRVGIMGASSTETHVRTFLAAMAEALTEQGRAVDAQSAIAAADEIYGTR